MASLDTCDNDSCNDFDDPLAVRIGIWASCDDIPTAGWPDDSKAVAVERILGYLPSDETEV